MADASTAEANRKGADKKKAREAVAALA